MKKLKAFRLIGLLVVIQTAQTQEQIRGALTLDQAVSFALKNSPLLRASSAEVAAAKAETDVLRARQRPQLSVSGFLSRGNMPNILQSVAGIEPKALILSPDQSFADANLMLMTPLYTGGLLSGLVTAAIAREQAAIAEANDLRAEVVFRVREAFLNVLLAAELVKAEQARVTAAQEMVRTAKAKLESGKGIEAFVQRAEGEFAEAQQELVTVENERQKMLLDLFAEMGASLESSISLSETLSFKPIGETLQFFLGKASQMRGELIAARQRVRAAQGQLASAEGTFRPQIYGFAMADAFSPRDMKGNNAGYTIGLAVSLPLFDGGSRRSEVATARAMVEKAKATVERLELQTSKEVRQIWFDIETTAQNYRTAEKALTAAQATYEVAAIRTESGKGILIEQLDALAALTRARTNLTRAAFNHHLAVARLYRAIGDTGTLLPRGSQK